MAKHVMRTVMARMAVAEPKASEAAPAPPRMLDALRARVASAPQDALAKLRAALRARVKEVR